jgi:hypothetical protein
MMAIKFKIDSMNIEYCCFPIIVQFGVGSVPSFYCFIGSRKLKKKIDGNSWIFSEIIERLAKRGPLPSVHHLQS